MEITVFLGECGLHKETTNSFSCSQALTVTLFKGNPHYVYSLFFLAVQRHKTHSECKMEENGDAENVSSNVSANFSMKDRYDCIILYTKEELAKLVRD